MCSAENQVYYGPNEACSRDEGEHKVATAEQYPLMGESGRWPEVSSLLPLAPR